MEKLFIFAKKMWLEIVRSKVTAAARHTHQIKYRGGRAQGEKAERPKNTGNADLCGTYGEEDCWGPTTTAAAGGASKATTPTTPREIPIG